MALVSHLRLVEVLFLTVGAVVAVVLQAALLSLEVVQVERQRWLARLVRQTRAAVAVAIKGR